MATRFWVGGAGLYNSTAHWSTTSGGAGGASVPTNVDTAVFDGNSGTGLVQLSNGSFRCSTLRVEDTNSGLELQGEALVYAVADLSGTIDCTALSVSFENDGYIDSTRAISTLIVNGRYVEVWSSMTVLGVQFDSGGTLEVNSSSTLTTSSITGPYTTPVAYIRSSLNGTQADITDSSGSNTLNNLDVKDIAFGGVTWYKGSNFVDSGNNSGLSELPATGGLFMSDF